MSLSAAKELFQKQFAAQRKISLSAEPAWLIGQREKGMGIFSQTGFPTTKHEEWKYTNIAPLAEIDFERIDPQDIVAKDHGTLDASSVEAWKIDGCETLVFFDGVYLADVSSKPETSSAITWSSLRSALTSHPELIEKHLGRYVSEKSHTFAALNHALWQDGAFIYLPENAKASAPIQLLFVSSGKTKQVSHYRNLYLASASSQATIIESYVTLASNGSPEASLTNVVSEISLEKQAKLNRITIQNQSAKAFNVCWTQAKQQRESYLGDTAFSIGGRLSRFDINTTLAGERSHATLNGLFIGHHQQHIDFHTLIEHQAPHCTSAELYKGILDDDAEGVFNGKVYVHREAQKTDAKQSNKNLLLSSNASINAKPQLEIFADDVKCTHGATIGQLDEQALFYLRSRGLDAAQAKQLLIHAFAGEVVDSLSHEATRNHLERCVRVFFAGNHEG